MDNMDIDAARLVKLIHRVANKGNSPDNMTFGVVTSIDPLKVDIGNNIIIDDKHLFLGQMCRPHRVTIPHSHLVDTFLSDSSRAINTKSISAGTSTDEPQNTASYDVKTQEITRNDDEGTNERELKTETKSNVDLGGATFKMKVDVAGSGVTGSSVSGGAVTASVVSTADKSTFTVTDDKHLHIIPEHETQDVHFPGTDYEDSVEIEIYPRLKVGDKVLLFSFNNHQMYYVAERIEEE